MGIIIAAAAIALSVQQREPRIDGIGSILIGCILAIIALLLARESKGLLIGERANPALSAAIREIARNEPGVSHVNQVLTIHLAPAQVVATVSLDFDDTLTTRAIEHAIVSIECQTKAKHPEVIALSIRPQARDEFDRH
jgi:divalent metal cation (Fe/Co/Zn/Cd) transporter